MKNCLILFFCLLCVRSAYGIVQGEFVGEFIPGYGYVWVPIKEATSCANILIEGTTPNPDAGQASFRRFSEVHREGLENNPQVYQVSHFPKFSSIQEEDAYIAKVREAKISASRLIAQAAESEHVPTTFSFHATVFGLPFGERIYPGLNGRVLQKSQFKSLNQSLGKSGLWFIFRTYSWDHMGYQQMAGPHMSVVIGDRVYEIGRRLRRVGSELKLTTRGPAGPIAMDIDEFLLKTSLESKALNAKPGFFLATRVSGVSETALRALATYYEKDAKEFEAGKSFKYVLDPANDPEGRNCVTYLTEPMLNKELTGGIDVERALSIGTYSVSPAGMMYELSHYSALSKALGPIMFVDSDTWRSRLDERVRENIGKNPQPAITDDSFPGGWNEIEIGHPQLRGFLGGEMQFYYDWGSPD